MNKERRASIEEALNLLGQAAQIIADAKDEEQSAYENLSEGLQQTERGQSMESAAYTLDNALSSVESAISEVEEAIE